MITDSLKEKLGGIRNGMTAKVVTKAFGGLKNVTLKALNSPKLDGLLGKKPLLADDRIGNTNTSFYTAVSSGVKSIIRKHNTATDIGTKINTYLQYTYDQKVLRYELAATIDKIEHEQEKKRQQDVLDALGTGIKLKETHQSKTNILAKPKGPSMLTKVIEDISGVAGKTVSKLKSEFEAMIETHSGTMTKIEGEMIKWGITAAGAVAIGAGIGAISAKYESNGDPGAVSSGKNDKGGVSYGTYQLSTNSGNADEFVKQSSFKDQFIGLKAGTAEFSEKWKNLGQGLDKDKFAAEQKDFIGKKNYLPALEKAKNMGYAVDDKGVADAIWSLSIQHGQVQKVLDLSKKNMGDIVDKDPKKEIESLYRARDDYTKSLHLDFSKRYKAEVQDALKEVGTPIDTGDKLDKASVMNKDLKKSVIAPPIIFDNKQNIFVSSGDNSPGITFTGARQNSKPPVLEEQFNGGQ